MYNNYPEMAFLRNIGILMTYKCQVTCPHCIIEAGPHRKEELTLKNAYHWIKEISNYRNGFIKVLALTGGEPFINLDKLIKISSFAESHNLFVSAVTNAFWASTKEKGVEILKKVPAIKMISISTDIYHLHSIPFERVKNAIFAARECKLLYTVSICTEDENDESYKLILDKLNEFEEKDNIRTALLFKAGRALKKIKKFRFQIADEPPVSACSAGSSPIIFPDGKVFACIGPIVDLKYSHPLLLGDLNIDSLEVIFNKAELNPILHSIRVWGPKKIISIIKKTSFKKYLPDYYIKDSVCNACYSIMSNSNLINFLNRLAEENKFKKKVAYARIYYLHEEQMIKNLI
jgi:MoaA/NifB/PqqE/SkfB family radical SAM enzyme